MKKQKKSEIWDELSNMVSKKVKLEDIYLDPNNPRFEIPLKEKVPDERIMEEEIGQMCMEKMRAIGITDLTESIRTSGFWIVDRVVLRPILDSDKYVVVEGNRRITALKTLLRAHKRGRITLPDYIKDVITEFEALIYNGTDHEIAWIIQGFRHTPGIKSWERYPKAKFLAEFKKEKKKSFSGISSIFGMKRIEVTNLIRSFHAFEQAKEDEEYGDILDSDKFGHFYDIILKKPELKNWMGWDDKRMVFTEISNLKKYLSWISPEEGEEKPKIDISPTTRDVLPKLIQQENKKLFEKFESGELTIRQCEENLLKEEIKEESKREALDISDVIKNIEGMKMVINTLPIAQLQLAESTSEKEQKKKLCTALEELLKFIQIQIDNLKK
ncbi:hypothetical protein BEH94_11695 [Candidatus Altiarchaeales archaeon WOR_SM1_SCG]|nr:hypothetical protein BEH94_11695 [Candidatus Altiarchaeales archaeon WOR_SM1_SCG]